jgi:membrane-associated phospholipid phosphatase
MAEVVSAPQSRATPGWWPVDFLFTAYLAAIGLLIAAFYRRVPDTGLLLAAHGVGIALVIAATRVRSGSRLEVFHFYYPLLYLPLLYKEMAILIPAIRRVDFDALMARLDYRIWGAHATVWLERLQTPPLTEFLQLAYTLFIPMVILVAAALWSKRLYPEFRYYGFLVTLGFLASYVGYFLVPVRGPRFFLAHLQHIDLQGLWLFGPMQHLLDRLESAHYDCFPSGHIELTLIAWWSSRHVSAKLFAVFSVYSICIVSATVYLRYHYTVDVFAGAALAAVLLAVAPRLYAATLAAEGAHGLPSHVGMHSAPAASTEVTN